MTTDWGVSVTEAQAQSTLRMKGLATTGWLAVAVGAFLIIPVLVGSFFFSFSTEILLEACIVIAIVAIGRFFQVQARKGPKNALQIDYDASELRLGSVTPQGAFVRHKTCALRSISSVAVNTSQPDRQTLIIEMFGETATMHFSGSDGDALTQLAAKIQEAADIARAAPIRTRIVSRINGLEAGVREISRRVRSRVQTGFA